MTFLLSLDENSTDYSKIIDLLPRYEQKVKEAAPIFNLEGRRLEEIMRTLPHYQSNYDQTYQELKALEEWMTVIKDRLVAKYWRKYTESYSRVLTTRDIQAYIAGEKEIVQINQIMTEVSLIKNDALSIVEAIKQMGWMVGNITKLRIAEMEDAIL
jgi:hypothetical protein